MSVVTCGWVPNPLGRACVGAFEGDSLQGKKPDHYAQGGAGGAHARGFFASVADRVLMRSNSRDSLESEVGDAPDRKGTSLCDVFGSDPLLDEVVDDDYDGAQAGARDGEHAAAAHPDRGMTFMTAG